MELKAIGIVGAGIMGNGLVQVCAAAGFRVTMVDISPAALESGRVNIASNLNRLVAKGKLESKARDVALARIATTAKLEDLAHADAVIEAATETETLKLRILKQVAELVGDHTLIATNTSSLSITRLAAAVSKPERFIGMHFFNPPPLMPLVEVIRGLQTSDETQARAEALAQAIGKVAIVVKNSPGFAVNRIFCPMINEAIFTLQEGLASAEQIDEGCRLGLGHPMGPLALVDMIGLDTMLMVLDGFYTGFNDPKYRPAPLLKEMVDAGYLGRKTGRGFYKYS